MVVIILSGFIGKVIMIGVKLVMVELLILLDVKNCVFVKV